MSQKIPAGVHGPHFSERFGHFLRLHLGGPPGGECGWECVYCDRKGHAYTSEFIGLSELLKQFRDRLSEGAPLDSVVIVGNSDPSLHPEFSALVKAVVDVRAERKGKWKIACLINSASKADGRLLPAFKMIDELCVKIDCASEELFRRVNRPAKTEGGLAQHLEVLHSLPAFSVQSTLWRCGSEPELENWTHENLEGLVRVCRDFKPKAVYLATIKHQTDGHEFLPISDGDLGTLALRIEEMGISVKMSHFFPGGDFSG